MRKMLLNIEGFDDNELYRLSKLRESGGGGGVSIGSGASIAGQSGAKQRKLISQITSIMLVPAKLNLTEDVLSDRDWKQLLKLDGVTVTTRRQGEVLVEQGETGGPLLRIVSGQATQQRERQDVIPWICDLAGGLGILKPDERAPVTVKVASETCEV